MCSISCRTLNCVLYRKVYESSNFLHRLVALIILVLSHVLHRWAGPKNSNRSRYFFPIFGYFARPIWNVRHWKLTRNDRYNFWLTFHHNHRPVLYYFQDKYKPKFSNYFEPSIVYAPAAIEVLLALCVMLGLKKTTRMMGAYSVPCREKGWFL